MSIRFFYKRKILKSLSIPIFTLFSLSMGSAFAADTLALTDPLPTNVPKGTVLNVADQNEVLQTLFAASGVGKNSVADIHFRNFHNGPEILEGVRAGVVDIGLVGDAPPIQAQANGDPVLIVGVQRNSDRVYQLAVAPNANVKTIKDIRGKRIAYAPGTGREAFTLRTIEQAGLTPDQVTLVNLSTSDFTDALRSDRVDLAALMEPNLTQYVTAYGAKGGSVLNDIHGASTGLMYVYARKAVLENPAKAAAIREFISHWVRALKWANGHDEEWINAYYVKNEGLSPENGRKIYATSGPTSFPKINQKLFDIQQHTADILFSVNSIKKKIDVKEEFDPRFDEVIQEAALEGE